MNLVVSKFKIPSYFIKIGKQKKSGKTRIFWQNYFLTRSVFLFCRNLKTNVKT